MTAKKIKRSDWPGITSKPTQRVPGYVSPLNPTQPICGRRYGRVKAKEEHDAGGDISPWQENVIRELEECS